VKKNILWLVLFSFFVLNVFAQKSSKIVALLPMRNESLIIAQCLKALSLYADAIVVFDDASEDNSVEIVESLAKECKVEKILRKKVWKRDESADRSLLLKAGREIGGTHFITIDADEMFEATCLKDNYLRKRILALQPGDYITMPLVQLWRGVDKFRVDDGILLRSVIFCDDEKSKLTRYYQRFIHTGRIPQNLSGKDKIIGTHYVLHFQSVNIKNMGIRQAWYRCIEHIRYDKTIEELNKKYVKMTDETGIELHKVPKSWYAGYDFFDASVYKKIDVYRRAQVYGWFDKYGFEFFADLNLEGLKKDFGEVN